MPLTDTIKRLRRVSRIGLMRVSMIDGIERNPVSAPANAAPPEHQVVLPADRCCRRSPVEQGTRARYSG